MTQLRAGDEALASFILIEELFGALAKASILSDAVLADVVRASVARLDTLDHSGAAASVRHFFEHRLKE